MFERTAELSHGICRAFFLPALSTCLRSLHISLSAPVLTSKLLLAGQAVVREGYAEEVGVAGSAVLK